MALAPMADVTDPAYRRLIAETAKPDVMWSEFVSADGLFHTRESRKKGTIIYDSDIVNPLVRELQFSEDERPIIAQFFSSNPETMEYAARYALQKGFDGVDINMGCPDKSIEKQGAGAGHIRNPERAVEVIKAALRGTEGKIPVSVKTRLGYNKIQYQEWLPHLLATDIMALTLHLRTRKEMSSVPAHYELASEIVSFCRAQNQKVLLLGNGDLESIADARTKAIAHGFDGMMLGRAIFGNPWLFSERELNSVSPEERISKLLQLAQYFDELKPRKHFATMKKHFKAFISGWSGAAELRARCMETNSLQELIHVLKQ